MLSGDPRKWSTPQKEHAEGRTRPACARRPPRGRADRTTVCAACRTDDAGSGRSFIFLAQASPAKGRQIPRIQPRNPRRRAGRRSARRPVPACLRIWSAPLT